MVISMAILIIMSTALAGAFSSGFSTYGSSRELERNLETAQYALNTLEKYLRTSTVISAAAASTQAMTFYDYSSQRCFRYRILVSGSDSYLAAQWFQTSDPQIGIASPSNPSAQCATTNSIFTTQIPAQVTTGYVTGGFKLEPSDKTSSPKKIGRVTVNLSVKKDNDPSSLEARIQATASLRDYTFVGF